MDHFAILTNIFEYLKVKKYCNLRLIILKLSIKVSFFLFVEDGIKTLQKMCKDYIYYMRFIGFEMTLALAMFKARLGCD